MTDTEKELLEKGWALFTRIFMKYDILEKTPIDLGTGDKLSAVHVHTIEAIGKHYGNTVTTLSSYFMVTKGAVSQVITRLYQKGYVRKTRRKGNDKEIILELTVKGRRAFDLHEQYNAATLADMQHLSDKYSPAELQSFINILSDIDGMLVKFVAEEKKQI